METQKIAVKLQTAAGRALRPGVARIKKVNNAVLGPNAADGLRRSREVCSAAVCPESSPDIDRDLLTRMRNPMRTRMTLGSSTAEVEAADYRTLTKNFKNLKQQRVRRFGLERAARTPVAWAAAILGIIGFLTAMLMVAIAISV